MRLKQVYRGIFSVAVVFAGVAWAATPGVSSASDAHSEVSHYQHIVEIMMENTSYGTIIGNANAPQINALANTYGLATNYWGVTHPSEPNYVANLGGSYFGIQDDNQFYCTPAMATTDPNCGGTTVNHTVTSQNLADQLSAAGMSWKGYFQSLPPTPAAGGLITSGPNANGPYTFKWPSNSVALYASKHNPFVNFTGTQGALANMVPDTQLASDLNSGKLPNFSYVVPDQCHDMHGTGGCSVTNALISAGDTYVGNTVNQIMTSKVWEHGRNAIVVTWDEDDYSDAGLPGTGCCGSDPGGGHVVTIVITNKGTHEGQGDHDASGNSFNALQGNAASNHGGNAYPLQDNTAYNHYSLLRSFEDAFGLPCLGSACDTAHGVVPMTPLFHP